MFGFLLSKINPYLMYAKIALVVIVLAATFYAGHHLATLQEDAAIAQAEKDAIDRTRAQDKITYDAGLAAATAQVKIQTVTVETIKKVPVYVTKKAVDACVVPVGFVRLLDASARGLQPVPDAAGQSNDAPAGIGLDDVAATGVANNGKYQEVAEQLRQLQAWVRAQQSVH